MPINVFGDSSSSHDNDSKIDTSLFVKKTLFENKLHRRQFRRRYRHEKSV